MQQSKNLIIVNELSEYSSLSQQQTPLLKQHSDQIELTSMKPKPTQVVPTNDEYAYTMTQHIQLIDDLASVEKTAICTQNWKDNIRKQFNTQTLIAFKTAYQINREIRFFVQFKKTYVRLMPIIDPQSSFLTYWKIPILVITFLVFIEVPLVIFFGDDFYYTFHNPAYIVFRTFVIFFFFLDIFIEFHVAYYQYGALVKNRHKVAFHYLTGSFIFDIVPLTEILITTFSYTMANVYTFHLLFLLKMYPVYEIDQRFQDKLQVYPKWKSIYMIGRMILEIVYLTHFFGCIFFGTGMYMLNHYNDPDEGKYTNSWLTFSSGNFGTILYYNWTKRYILSTYWAFATLTTVAYGDITPMNEFEIVVSEMAMIAAVFLVAFNVNNIQQTFVDYFDEKRKYNKEIVAITKFMRSKNVSEKTEKEIRNFLEHYFKEKRNRDQYLEEQVFNKLAPQLKHRLMYEAYQAYLNQVPWIVNNFSEDLIKELSQIVEEIDYSKKENIFLDGNDNLDDDALYFVQIGHIEIFVNVPETEKQEVILSHLKPGGRFGDYAFVTGLQRKASARSKKYSQVVKLPRTEFLNKVRQFPLDHQRFCFLRDEIIFNNAYHELGLQCYTCTSTDHMSVDCSLTHISITKEIIKSVRKSIVDKKLRKLQQSNQNIIQDIQQKRNILFNRKRQQKSKFVKFQSFEQAELDEYYSIMNKKIQFEAFYSENSIIIETFSIDKIENFVNYYPNFNIDSLIIKNNQRPNLVFAREVRQRSVSQIVRKSEIIL